jgi:hypothetical protein
MAARQVPTAKVPNKEQPVKDVPAKKCPPKAEPSTRERGLLATVQSRQSDPVKPKSTAVVDVKALPN